MKVKKGYLLREVAGNYVVVPTGKAALDFSGVITLNETGAFIWKQLASDKSEQELVAALLDEYDTEEVITKMDVGVFMSKLKAADLLE
jgi:hypothetical protein